MDYILYMNNLKESLEKDKSEYYLKKGKYDELKLKQERLTSKREDILSQLVLLSQTKYVLQKTGEYAREQSRRQMELLVTQCLQFIFNTPVEFSIELSEKRGVVDAEFYVISDMNGNKLKTRPVESRGGGVVDIISLAIRIAMLEINTPKIQGPLILDEPAKHVSDDYIFNVSEFLKQVSEMFKRQIIMITHDNHLSEIANRAYKVSLMGGMSIVTSIET